MSTYLSPGPPGALGLDLPQGPADVGGLPPGLPQGLPPGLQPEMSPAAPPADPLSSLQDAIHSVAAAMAALPGAQDTQDAAQALVQLSRIQTRLMQQGSGPAQG